MGDVQEIFGCGNVGLGGCERTVKLCTCRVAAELG